MEVDWNEHLGEKVIDKNTGEIRTIVSYSSRPSVTLFDKNGNRENHIGFCVGSPISKNWELCKEKESLSDKAMPVTNPLFTEEHGCFFLSDVRDSIKSLKDSIHDLELQDNIRLTELYEDVENIFGDRLTK